MNIKKIIILQLIIMCFLINLFSMPSNAASLDDTLTGADDFVTKGFSTDMDKSQLHSASNYIYNALLGVGIVVAVIVGMILGIKYMTGSIEEKAEYKKTMIPYLIGVVLLVAITQFIGLIANIVSNIDV